jgi:hypothetical protein
MCDQDYRSVTSGTGGPNNTFGKTNQLMTNDAYLYRNKDMNKTDRSMALMSPSVYYYRGDNDQMKMMDLSDRKKVFDVAKEINLTGKAFYSKCLDNKGGSQVTINDKPAGQPTKIQKKAYRANT